MTEHERTSEVRIEDLQQRLTALEAELQVSQQRAMTFFSQAPAPYFLLNAQGSIEDANSAASLLLGRTREGLLGKTLGQFMPTSAQRAFGMLLGQTLEDGLRQQGEVQLLPSDGAVLDVLLDLAPDTMGGTRQHVLLVATDVTAYKQAHQNLLDVTTLQEQQIHQHAARARVLNQELDSIVTTFIQQLHLPVARAMNFLGQLRPALGRPSEDTLRPLVSAERAVQQIIALLASMDRFMQMRHMRVRVRPVDLNKVFAEVLKNSSTVMVDRHVTVTSDPLPTVQGDSRALYVILDEYFANALKFSKEREDARIHIVARETDSEFHIGVEDNGSGFNMRQKHKLFQLFGRLHPSSTYEGTGVGLMNVRRTCERFGGRVWAEGKPDRGATFWFAWPKQPVLSND